MQINDYLEHAMNAARGTKEWACRKHPGDIRPYVCSYRADELIALVTLQSHVRDEILQAASISAVGFDADVISAVIETYGVDKSLSDPAGGINPHTGKRWGPGEMQDVAVNHGGIEKGWVHEALLVTVANRAGDVAAMNQSYRYSSKHLVWGTDAEPMIIDGRDNATFRGIVPDTLRRAMLRKSASQEFAGWAGFSVARTDRDIITAQVLVEKLACAPMLTSDAHDDSRIRKLRKVGVVIRPDE